MNAKLVTNNYHKKATPPLRLIYLLYFDECSGVWFSLEIENETFESTAIQADNLCTEIQDVNAASTTWIPPLDW